MDACSAVVVNSTVGVRIRFRLKWGDGNYSDYTSYFGPRNQREIDGEGLTIKPGTPVVVEVEVKGALPKNRFIDSDPFTFKPEDDESAVYTARRTVNRVLINGPL